MINKKLLTPLLITLLLLSIVVMGAPTYVNIGPTTEFEGDIGVPAGSGYYIGDIELDINWMTSGWTLTHLEDTLFFGAFSNIYYVKHGNLDATSAPTVNDDVDLDYVVGSRWIDVTADKEYICLDNTNGAAVWTETTGTGGGAGTYLELTDTPAAYDDGKYAKSTAAGVIWDTPAGAGTVTTSGSPIANDYARFTDATTIEGRSYSEMKTDLAYQLSDLSDVGVTTPTDKYVLVADGDSWESRALVEADISDLGTYLTDITGESIGSLSDVDLTDIADTKVLKYNNATSKWECEDAAGGYTNLTSFIDQTAWRIFYSNADGDVIELALGADGTYLGSNGAAAAPTFSVPSGAGDVMKVGTPVDSQIGVWTGDGTIEGAASLTYNGSNLQLTGDIGSTGTRITKGWFANLETTGDLTVNGTALASIYANLGANADITSMTGLNADGIPLAKVANAASDGANSDITSILNTALYVGRDIHNQIKFSTDNKIIFRVNGADRIEMTEYGELDMNEGTIGFTLRTQTGDGADTIDWRFGNKVKFTFGATNETFTFDAPTNPCNLLLMLIQDGTGSRTATWPATIKWAGGTAPTLTTAANAIDIVSFFYDGTNYFGVASLAFATP